MNRIKWRFLILSCLITLLPIVAGLLLWPQLPDEIAVHFNFYNEPDRFASKAFAVFGLPLIMVALQCFGCLVTDFQAGKKGQNRKLEQVSKWIIPLMSVLLQAFTLSYALGVAVDPRKTAFLILGIVFVALGNYMPKYKSVNEKERNFYRISGFLMVAHGVLFLITIFLPTIFSIVFLGLLIPTGIVFFVCEEKSKRG